MTLRRRGFTLIELLVVMAIIIVLAGLVLSISTFVQNKGGRSRAEAEIAAMSAALESYKADNGIYPYNSASTELNARVAPPLTDYPRATIVLYEALSGDGNGNRQIDATETSRSYYFFQAGRPFAGTAIDSAGIVDSRSFR